MECGAWLFGRGGLKIQAAGARCSVLGARCSVLGARCSVLGARCSVLGARCSVLGARCSVLGARCSVLGARCSVLGARCSVLGARCSVLGARCSAMIAEPKRWLNVKPFLEPSTTFPKSRAVATGNRRWLGLRNIAGGASTDDCLWVDYLLPFKLAFLYYGGELSVNYWVLIMNCS